MWEKYYQNGQLKEKFSFQDNKKQGPFEERFENGEERYYHEMEKSVKILVSSNCIWGRYRLKFHKRVFKEPYVDTSSRTIFVCRKAQ